ncbi:MAG TPA: GNAT family N-acetyltransferase [Rhizomicrobium sp.]|nr:GNAT family N-acetyltransferase [Rhizomicrobium sp.]
MNMSFTLRTAKPGDEDLILALLHELAVYEKLTAKFKITREVIARDFIGEHAPLKVDLLYEGDKPAGIATWYFTYNSFAVSRGVFLEDLFVRPEFRGRGYGKALIAHLARQVVKVDGNKVEWAVLDWNTPSIDFYEGLGAERMSGWHIYSLAGEALAKLGS